MTWVQSAYGIRWGLNVSSSVSLGNSLRMNDLSSQHSDCITVWMAWCHSVLSLWCGSCDLTSICIRENETAYYQCPGRLWERSLLLIHWLQGAKRQGCKADYSTSCCAWIKDKVELHHHSTYALEIKWFTGGDIWFMEILYLLYTPWKPEDV